jgi:crotonobetainyl-CoA:carnitine CoA-transferase CaiB-like acyl-CoA transferase
MSDPVAPLAGVRVLDLSRVLAGPYCSMILADLGADVIKVERPGSGDPTRAWGPPFRDGESAYYLCVNRGKRSVTIDLGDPAGVEVAKRLAHGADIVLESFLPGGADRLGLGYASVSATRPQVVYTSIAGYSPESADAHRPGFDFAIQAEAGGMSITGEADGPPLKVGVAIADITTGMFASIGTLAALRDAERSGQGRHVQVSLFDSQLAWLANRGSDWLVGGEEPHRLGNAHPAIVPYEAFASSDGWVIVAIGTNGQFTRFCEAAGLPDMASDARYATNAQRVEHRLELAARLADAIRLRPTADWLAVLETANVPGGPVRTIPEAFAHAPYAVVEHAHPTLGAVHTVRSPIGFDGAYPTAAAAPPLLGQHTAEVLDELGYRSAERDALLRGACRLI